jgi:hypothetical protein
MKMYFPNCGSGAGISIRAAINALLNWHKAERTQTAPRKKNLPQITPGWDYRPREATRAYAAVDSAGAATSGVLSPDPFGINNNVWCNDNSLECAASTFISGRLDAEELMPKVLSETPDPVCTAPTVDDVAVSMYD